MASRGKSASNLRERLRFETLLFELSSAFAKISADQVEEEIDAWLRRLVEFLGVDRGSFLRFASDGTTLYRTHSYTVPGLDPLQLKVMNPVFPWTTEQLRRGNTVKLERLPEDLPEVAVEEKRYVQAIGMKSGLNIPVSICGSISCVLAFTSLRRYQTWSEDMVARLRVVGEVFGTAIDRKRSELALRRSEERFRSLVEASAQVVWIADPEGRATEGTQWMTLTGQSLEQAKGWGWLDAIHPDDRVKTEQAWLEAVAAKSVCANEYRLRLQDGSYRLFAVRGVPVLDEAGPSVRTAPRPTGLGR